jgi:hypothetical protein
MIFAQRGVGKTWLALEFALAIANGRTFFKWPVTSPRRVLRAAPPENLMLLPSEPLFRDGFPLSINKPEHQARLLTLLDDLDKQARRPEVLIFDNLSSLTSGMDENSNSDLDAFLTWLVQLRHRGYAVVVVHHAGKNGQQRGASRREDLLDTSIKLEELPRNARQGPPGAAFTVSFEKTRGRRPNPDTLTVELISSAEGGLAWAVGTPASLSADMRALIKIYETTPSSQTELAIKLGVTESAVSQTARKLRDRGLLARGKGLNLTKEGYDRAEKLGAGSGPI